MILIALCSTQLYTMKIAIDLDPQWHCAERTDGWDKKHIYVPILMYSSEKKVCGSLIPLKVIAQANDEDTVYDDSDGSGNIYQYVCQQSHTQSNLTFAQALHSKLIQIDSNK